MADPYDTPGYRYSVNEFPGDGTTINWNIQFAGRSPGYISIDHVRASIIDEDGVETPITLSQSNFVQPTLLRIEPPVPAGSVLRVWRDTPKDEPLLDYNDGALMTERNLDTSFAQAVYAAAEMVDRAADSLEDVEEFSLAVLDRLADVENTANTARDTADAAQDTANAAFASAASAVSTANDALAGVEGATEAADLATAAANAANAAAAAATTAANDAEQAATDSLAAAAAALSTAANAESVALGIDGKAQDALDTAAAALSTATNAESVALGIDGKAQDALDAAADAIATANAAEATANGVDAKATQALADSADALSTATTALNTASALSVNLEWLSQPLGVPIPIFTHLFDNVDDRLPPLDDPRFRYVYLAAGDPYNSGVLTNETVTGSAPEITATAQINDPGSPFHGKTIHLIGTERRFLRGAQTAGVSGTVAFSQNKAHNHTASTASAGSHVHAIYGNDRVAGTGGGTVRSAGDSAGVNSAAAGTHTHAVTVNSSGGTEAYPTHITAAYVMRIR